MSIKVWPGAMTPPTVKIERPITVPETGARIRKSLQLVVCSSIFGHQIAKREFDLAKFGRRTLAIGFFRFDLAQAAPARHRPRLGNTGLILAPLTLKVGLRPFQRPHPRLGNKSLVGDRPQGIDFCLDQPLLLRRRHHLRSIAGRRFHSLAPTAGPAPGTERKAATAGPEIRSTGPELPRRSRRALIPSQW